MNGHGCSKRKQTLRPQDAIMCCASCTLSNAEVCGWEYFFPLVLRCNYFTGWSVHVSGHPHSEVDVGVPMGTLVAHRRAHCLTITSHPSPRAGKVARIGDSHSSESECDNIVAQPEHFQSIKHLALINFQSRYARGNADDDNDAFDDRGKGEDDGSNYFIDDTAVVNERARLTRTRKENQKRLRPSPISPPKPGRQSATQGSTCGGRLPPRARALNDDHVGLTRCQTVRPRTLSSSIWWSSPSSRNGSLQAE